MNSLHSQYNSLSACKVARSNEFQDNNDITTTCWYNHQICLSCICNFTSNTNTIKSQMISIQDACFFSVTDSCYI